MEHLPGHQPAVESLWATGAGARRHFDRSTSTLEKDRKARPVYNGHPSAMSPLGFQWTSHTTTTTTKPRPVFSPQTSFSFKQQQQQQPPPFLPPSVSIADFQFPPSNSDLLVGSMNQRDQFEMDTPLNTPLDTPVPAPPPYLSGARLGAIIVLYVALRPHPAFGFCPEHRTQANNGQYARRPSLLCHGHHNRLHRPGDHRHGSVRFSGHVLGCFGIYALLPWYILPQIPLCCKNNGY